LVQDMRETFKGEKMLQKAEDLNSLLAYSVDEQTKDRQLVLLDNVQFIYELALAQLELQSFGVQVELMVLENLNYWLQMMRRNLKGD